MEWSTANISSSTSHNQAFLTAIFSPTCSSSGSLDSLSSQSHSVKLVPPLHRDVRTGTKSGPTTSRGRSRRRSFSEQVDLVSGASLWHMKQILMISSRFLWMGCRCYADEQILSAAKEDNEELFLEAIEQEHDINHQDG
jgi:hypothetical protein